MATFCPSTNPASFRPCSNAAARCSEPAAVVLRRNPITGTADCCERAASGHATIVLLKSLMNSRLLMASPALRTKSGIKRLSHFWIENCAVRRTQAGPQPCPLCAKSGHYAAQQKGACRGFAGYLLLFDPVQAPPLGHAFESVNAAILKA